MRPPVRRHAGQRGVALLEALIAILLLSMCALAYAALQLRGLSNNASAMWRTQAVQLTQEMSDRMRGNQAGVAAGAYSSLLSPQGVPACGSNSSCTPAQTATLDYAQWSSTIASVMPGGTGVVCIDATPDDGSASAPACDGQGTTFAIKVFWAERGVPSRVAIGVRP